jgi:hypothetical protein
MKTAEKTTLGLVLALIMLFSVTAPSPSNTITPPTVPTSPATPKPTDSPTEESPSQEELLYRGVAATGYR